MNEEENIFNEKNYLSEDEGVMTQAACLNRIFQKVNREGLSEGVVMELKDDLDHISGLYGVDAKGAVLFSAILEKTETGNPMDGEDLARFLGCTNIEFLRYHEVLRNMEKAGIIQSAEGRCGRVFRVTEEAMRAVSKDCEFKPVKVTGLSTEELFTRFRKYFKAFRSNSINAQDLIEELESIIRYNEQLTFSRKVIDSPLFSDCTAAEGRMFFYLCHRYVTHGERSVDLDTLMNFTEPWDNDEFIRRQFTHEETSLQRIGLVMFANEDGMVNTDALSLSDVVRDGFLRDIEPAPLAKVTHRDVVSADSIQPKELFYNPEEGALIARLESLLEDENFHQVQARLAASGMRKGFNVLLYGGPGTGKTASVYELARRTGRDIFAVDMAKIKSKWVGESEKSIKSVFNLYRAMCRSNGKAPILLFNEADAVFSKRLDNIEQSVDQMNNAIQNIILQEMETLDGVLIATTNMLNNLDDAFERRFIFKVEFRLPGKESRAKIWKSMIVDLSDAEAEELAGKYTFSGGNIENVARKSTVEYVLSGTAPSLASIESLCEEEFLAGKRRVAKIGF